MDIICKTELSSLESLSERSRLLAPLLPSGVVIGLFGPLGVGKTELVRGILRGLGVEGVINSPSFVLESEYEIAEEHHPTARMAHHWDLYRLRGEGAPEDLMEHIGRSSKLIFVEWPAAIEDYLGVKIVLDFAGGAEEEAGIDADVPHSRTMEISISSLLCQDFFDFSTLDRESESDLRSLDFEQLCSVLAEARQK